MLVILSQIDAQGWATYRITTTLSLAVGADLSRRRRDTRHLDRTLSSFHHPWGPSYLGLLWLDRVSATKRPLPGSHGLVARSHEQRLLP